PFLRVRCHPDLGGVHVWPTLARAGPPVGNHWLCVGLQHRVDDSAGHRETWTLSHSGSCSLVEAMAIRTGASPSGRHAKGCEVNQKRKIMPNNRKKLVVKPGSKIRLKHFDPGYHGKHESHKSALPEIEENRQKMQKLQFLMYAENQHSLLIVLQGLDAGGKDGVVRHVLTGMNPSGCISVN